MALKYEDVKSVDAAKISSAAADWSNTSNNLRKAGQNHEVRVVKVLKEKLSGEFADSAASKSSKANTEITGAAGEAKAISSILNDGARKLRTLVKELDDLEEAIRKDERVVTAKGVVQTAEATNETPMSAGAAEYRQQQSEEPRISVAAAEQRAEKTSAWQRKLDTVVRKFDQLDNEMKIALDRASLSYSRKDGAIFNRKAISDLEQIKVDKAEELVLKLNSESSLTQAEREELRAIVRESAKDEALAKKLLNKVGAENFLRLAGTMEGARWDSGANQRKMYDQIEKGFADTLARASRDSAFTEDWREELRKYGPKKYPNDQENARAAKYPARGYQMLLTLMENGDGYSKKFLHGITDDVISLEKKSGGSDKLWRTEKGLWGDDFTRDPLDSLLGVMARSSETATSYYEKDLLKYIDDREWALMEGSGGKWEETPDARRGNGDFMLTVATGRAQGDPVPDPLVHSDKAADAAEHIIRRYSEQAESDPKAVHQKLLVPIAKILADYPDDFYDIVAQERNKRYIGQESEIFVESRSLRHAVRAIAEDPAAHEILRQSQIAKISREIEGLNKDSFEVQGNRDSSLAAATSGESGKVAGMIDGERAAAIDSWLDDKEKQEEIRERTKYNVLGAAVTGIPYIGDGFQRGLSVYFNDYAREAIDEYAEIARGGRRWKCECMDCMTFKT